MLPQVIQNKIMPEPNSGCWLWTGYIASNGYGKGPVRVAPGLWTQRWAHRLVYEAIRGPIPKGLHLDHKCRVTCCVNPDHLEPVTPRENQRRGKKNRDGMQRRTHCKRGHEYTPENIFYRQSPLTGLPMRKCKTCFTTWWSNFEDPRRGSH